MKIFKAISDILRAIVGSLIIFAGLVPLVIGLLIILFGAWLAGVDFDVDQRDEEIS